MKSCRGCHKMISEKDMIGDYCRVCLVDAGEEVARAEEIAEADNYSHDDVENAKEMTEEEWEQMRQNAWDDVQRAVQKLRAAGKTPATAAYEDEKEKRTSLPKEVRAGNGNQIGDLVKPAAELKQATDVPKEVIQYLASRIKDANEQIMESMDEAVESVVKDWYKLYDFWLGVGAYKVITKEDYLQNRENNNYGAVIATAPFGKSGLYLINMMED